MASEIVIPCSDLIQAIEFFTGPLGFRLDMVEPADDPSTAVISGHGVVIRLERSPVLPSQGSTAAEGVPAAGRKKFEDKDRVGTTPARARSFADGDISGPKLILSTADGARWLMGRAGMEYRDLLPGKLGGRLSASLIRLSTGGEPADYVHYHKAGFQMIYCWHGKVKVVYEDQGDAFWLRPGDCVLQPPEIRHRVLESSAGARVIELTSPAVHETWADHDLLLPTGHVNRGRNFGGQRFILHRAADSAPVLGEFGDFEAHYTGIHAASGGAAHVIELRTQKDHSTADVPPNPHAATFYFVLSGRLDLSVSNTLHQRLTTGDSITLPPAAHTLSAIANSAILGVIFNRM